MSTIALSSATASYHVTLAPESGSHYPRALRDDVARALTTGERHVVIDCSDWRELDLRVLSALVRCARACGEIGAGFELVNLDENLKADLRDLRLEGRVGYLASARSARS